MVGIIGAMSTEIALLREHLENATEREIGKLVFYSGQIEEISVVIVKSGMGKVNAALCAQLLIDVFGVECIINTGIAGGVGANLSVGDLVIGTSSVQHDFDLSGVGYQKGCIFGNREDSYTVFPSDEDLVKKVRESAQSIMGAQNVHEGRIATGDQFIADRVKNLWIRDSFDALAVEMEGGAIAHVAYVNEIPCVIIRAISDLANDEALESVENFEEVAANASARILVGVLKALVPVPVV